MIEDGIKSITDNTSFQKLASELSSLNKKTMKYVRDNPILVAGAVIGLGVAGFATYKLLKGSSEIAKESVSHS